MELKGSFLNRFKQAMDIRNMKQSDLVLKTGIGKSAISQYATGKYLPKQQSLFLLAQALSVSEAWLMGYDVPMEKEAPQKMWDKFDMKYNTEKLASEASLFELIQKQYGESAVQLLTAFVELNDIGQDEAVKRIEELTEISKYTVQKGQESLNA